MATAEPLPPQPHAPETTPQTTSHAPPAQQPPAHPDRDGDIIRRSLRVALFAIPLFVAFWVGVVALAISFTSVGYAAPLAMAAGVGVLAGVFWASWYGFVAFAHDEETDRRAP